MWIEDRGRGPGRIAASIDMKKLPDSATILLLTTSYGPGGAERMVATLSAILNQDRYKTLVGISRPGWLQDECERLNVESRVIPLAGPLNMQWFRTCFKVVRHEKVALIHAHEFSAIVYGWIVARLAGVPFVGTIHGKNYFWEKLRRRMAYRIISRSGRLVAVSEDLKRFVMDTVGLPDTRVQVIYNGVQVGSPVSDADVGRCREELSLNAGDLVIGSIGSLYPVKGHQYLLDAVSGVFRQYPRAVLLLAGSGELETSLKEQTARLGIERHVRFLGIRLDVSRLLALMDVFVLPSLSEGLSLALLEAMAARRAVVATRVGGNAELVVEGETGMLVPSKDSEQLASAICKLLGDKAMREEFGRKAATRIQERFSAVQMADRYQCLYRELLGAE
jgi:glycosyltransferase involved in cell wall biosynthesis